MPKSPEKSMEEPLTPSEEIKVIPAFPSSEIVLKEEGIPPLDIFYSPKHQAVMKRQRKKIKIDHFAIFPGNKKMDVVWKDTPIDLSEKLTKLSQFVGAYAAAMIDKAKAVRNLIREKEERRRQLEDQITREE